LLIRGLMYQNTLVIDMTATGGIGRGMIWPWWPPSLAPHTWETHPINGLFSSLQPDRTPSGMEEHYRPKPHALEAASLAPCAVPLCAMINHYSQGTDPHIMEIACKNGNPPLPLLSFDAFLLACPDPSVGMPSMQIQRAA
jgi:hypothetical protein